MKALVAGALLVSLAACAMRPAKVAPTQRSCVQLFEQLDAAVQVAGVRDGGEYAVPGFPWARSNRFLASYAADLAPVQTADWLQGLRGLDQQARAYELARLNAPQWPLDSLALLQHCGDVLVRETFNDPVAVAAVRQAVAVPDDYSWWARAVGLYPLSMPFLRLGVGAYQREVQQQFSAPLPAPQGRWKLWQSAASEASSSDINWRKLERNQLGVPQLSAGQIQQLASQYAPAFVVDEVGEYDRPGRPLALAPEDEKPGFDVTAPTLHHKLAWTRWGDQVLPQLVYTLWFSKRPEQGVFDPYAGELDGVMWRVTLDAQGRPLIYDTVHACGCYHYHFPARNLPLHREQAWSQEPLLFPQGQVPWSHLAVVLESGTHYVLRVMSLAAGRQLADGKPAVLNKRDYDDLRHQAAANGQHYSLFAPDGLVTGSQRLERWWLWPSGVPSPGAMRQWGRHATAFVGRAHFDDPYFLKNLGLAAPPKLTDKD